MKRIIILANLTFKEGIRNRALFGITIVATMMLTATIVFTGLFAFELGKVMMDLIFSTIAFAGLLLTCFVNINLIDKDIDKKTIYVVLSKPFSRTEYILGKYSGLVLLVFTALCFLMCFSTGIISIIKSTTPPTYFKDFSWLCFFQAFLYEMLMFMLLNAVVIFFSTITTSSFLTFLLTVSIYITGQNIESVVEFFKHEALKSGAGPSPVNYFFVNILQYIFPNFSAFDIKTLAAHGKLLSMHHSFTIFGYSMIYTVILLFFSIIIFERRELT